MHLFETTTTKKQHIHMDHEDSKCIVFMFPSWFFLKVSMFKSLSPLKKKNQFLLNILSTLLSLQHMIISYDSCCSSVQLHEMRCWNFSVSEKALSTKRSRSTYIPPANYIWCWEQLNLSYLSNAYPWQTWTSVFSCKSTASLWQGRCPLWLLFYNNNPKKFSGTQQMEDALW